jgi:hypothetical protein
MKKYVSALLFVALLVGCKAEVETKITFSEIVSGVTKITSGDIYVEITTCGDHEDTRKPSESLLQVKSKIPSIFVGAEYVECFNKKLDTFAHFRIPVSIDGNNNGKLESDNAVTLLNEKSILYVAVPSALAKRINEAKNDPDGAGLTDISIQINMNNDTKDGIIFKAFSSYIDGRPYVYTTLCAHPNDPFVVRISNVSVDEAITEGKSVVMAIVEGKKCS